MNIASWTPANAGLSLNDIDLWNAAMSHSGQTIAIPDKPASLRFTLATGPQSPNGLLSVAFKNGLSAYAHIDSFPFDALLSVDLTVEQVARLDGPLKGALFEGMANTILAALPPEIESEMSIRPVQEENLHKQPADAEDMEWLSVILEGLCAEPVSLTLGAKRNCLCQFLRKFSIAGRPLWMELSSALTVPAFRLLGFASLDLGDVRALQPGDILIIDQASAGSQTILANEIILEFEQADEGWLCSNRRRHSRQLPVRNERSCAVTLDEMPSEEEDEFAEDIRPISALQIQLSFDLGQIDVPLSDLESWQVGSVVQLDPALSKEAVRVIVRSNGQAVGEGDLVTIDDRMAVRLNRLFLV